MSFSEMVQRSQESAKIGEKAAALDAIQEALRGNVETAENIRRRELLDSLAIMVSDCQLTSKPVVQTSSTSRRSPAPATKIASGTAQRILVCGIGRTGTTLIYQQLAKLLQLNSLKVNFRYEPYLWNIQSPRAKDNPFNMSQLHQFGILAHTTTPLFLDGADPIHDSFLDHLFNETWDHDSKERPDSYLTKVIRGSGRLRSYLKRYPDLKIVACLRNPLDTINSSLGMFSFFGEEFHADDRPRLREELEARGEDISQLDIPDLSIEWYAKWWRVFTEEILAVAEEYPNNVMLFCYEAYQRTVRDTLETLMDFVGTHNLGIFMGLNKPAGPSINSTNLTQYDIKVLSPHSEYYTNTVLKSHLGEQDAISLTTSVISRHLEGTFSFPIAGSDLGRMSPIQLRGMIMQNTKSPFMSLLMKMAHTISLDDMIALHHPTATSDFRKPATPDDTIKKGKRFGAVITCYNNTSTIVGAVLSCLNQTLPFDEIVVVNDKSTDDSQILLAELAKRYSCIKILNLPSNLGPAAARDLGIRQLTTDFFTQLDGDDLFWPTKNAQEAKAVAGDEDIIAFSDILLVRPDKSFVQTTAAYHELSGEQARRSLLARLPQIPRDLTVSRKLYFKTEGYDMSRHLYEDWDLKLRLARESKTWVRADGIAGTIYNRLSPGLSGVDDGEHARALSQIFLSALKNNIDMPDYEVLPAFDAAMGQFKERHVAKLTRAVLKACLEQQACELTELADLVMQRNMRAIDNMSYAAALDAFASKATKLKVTI